MRLSNRFVMKLGGLGIAGIVRTWMSTLDYRAVCYNRTLDPAHPHFPGPVIYLFWHEYIPFPFYLRGHCNIAMLLSQHQDAEWLSVAARHMGFQTVRGSTNRGGVRAIRELLRKSRSMNLAITPDGPRGPRRRLAPGAIYLASRLGIPIVAMGYGYDRPWRVGTTWDQFAVPRPYSRARAITSPALHIPASLGREGLESYRHWVESILDMLTAEAERWAETGDRRDGQFPVRPEGKPLESRYPRAA